MREADVEKNMKIPTALGIGAVCRMNYTQTNLDFEISSFWIDPFVELLVQNPENAVCCFTPSSNLVVCASLTIPFIATQNEVMLQQCRWISGMDFT